VIALLRGIIGKEAPGEATVDVGGVGYKVHMPINAWDALLDGAEATVWVSTYVREDRLDLFGFADRLSRVLFEELIGRPGIGPRTALELCAVPRSLLSRAIYEQDASLLTSVKGIGKKTAEKLIVELKEVGEKHPDILAEPSGGTSVPAKFDRDAIAALTQLGYATSDVLKILDTLPKELKTTEERVTAALRAL
jgi:holliday junction DNA helicase RuvA